MTIVEDRPAVDDAPADPVPAVRERRVLTRGEIALVKILRDPSGLDQAEFLWVDETKKDGCWRAYPYQWPWWRAQHEKEIDACARAVGKSERIMAKMLAFPCNHPGQEMAFVAPQKKHVENLSKRVEARIHASRFYTALLAGGRHGGIKHQPFDIIWANGAYLLSRLPQLSGLGLKGLHPVVLEVDEGQDITPDAYNELPEVVRWDVPGASWTIHGVSKGLRDTFFQYSQPDSGFHLHHITAMHSPFWNDSRREQRVKEYGGSDQTPEYRRNVLGVHGEEADRLVNLHRLMLCTDDNEASHYNTAEYMFKKLGPEIVMDLVKAKRGQHRNEEGIEESTEAQEEAIREILTFPPSHKRYELTWMGMDFGLVADPSEIIVAAEYLPTPGELKADMDANLAVPLEGGTRLKVIARIQMKRLPAPLQAAVIMHLIDFYGPKAFSMDSTGNGLPCFQELQKRANKNFWMLDYSGDTERRPDMDAAELEAAQSKANRALTAIKGYNFSGKVIFGFDTQKLEELHGRIRNPTPEEMVEHAGIKRIVKDAGTDLIREVVDLQQAKFPSDDEITESLNGQTVSYSSDAIDPYGKRRYAYGGGKSHLCDAARMLYLGRHMHPIEAMIKPKKRKPVLTRFGV